MLGEVHRSVHVAVADVRRERKDDWKRVLLRVRLKHCCVERYAIAHRNLDPPAHVGDWWRRRPGFLRQAACGRHADRKRSKKNYSMRNLSCSHPTASAGAPAVHSNWHLRAHAWYRVREGIPTRRNRCFSAKALAIYEGAFAGAAATRFRILSRSTFLWFASNTSKRYPSRSTLSPGAGTLPETWLNNPAIVVTVSSASLPKFTPNNFSTSRIAILPRITNPPSASRTTSGAGAFPPFHLSPTISSTRSSTVAIPATEPCSSIITASGWPFCRISRSSSDPAFVSGMKSTGRTNSRTLRFGKSWSAICNKSCACTTPKMSSKEFSYT